MHNFNRNSYTYTPLFCEENIWKLIKSFYTSKLATPIDVLFIINPSNTVAVFEQSLSVDGQPMIWDYHVVLSACFKQQTVIFDFDSRCDFPAEINQYFAATFPENRPVSNKFQALLKAIPANLYLQGFSSDRKHMAGVIAEKEFPNYNIIQAANTAQTFSLQKCIDINDQTPDTHLFTVKEYLLSISP